MQLLPITPNDEAELELLSALLARLNIATTVIIGEDEEDVELGQVDRGEHNSTEL